jgi:hypothetical protein
MVLTKYLWRNGRLDQFGPKIPAQWLCRSSSIASPDGAPWLLENSHEKCVCFMMAMMLLKRAMMLINIHKWKSILMMAISV